MKKIILSNLLLFIALGITAQSYNSDKVSLTNFLVRMYNNAPFEGVRAVNDDAQAYLISVLALDKTKYKTEAILNRVASVKAMAQASRYFNGSNITQNMVIHTSDKTDGTTDTEIIENIREHSVGYVKALEQLTNFTREDGMQVFIFIKQLDSLSITTQGNNSDKVAFTNFLVRMYKNAPFEGVRAVDDYEQAYLISVLALDKTKYKTEAELNRVASVKAMAQATRYFNGSNITQDMIIRTSNKTDGTTDTEIIENIHEHSVGYVKALEQLTNFTREDGMQVFIFIKQLDNTAKKN